MPVGGAAPRTFAPGCKIKNYTNSIKTEPYWRWKLQYNETFQHLRDQALSYKNIYQISKFNSCSTVTTLQDLATISEVCAGFNIIVTGLLSCLINASKCMQNVSLRRNFKKNMGRGTAPPQTLSRWGADTPPKTPSVLYGASILAP